MLKRVPYQPTHVGTSRLASTKVKVMPKEKIVTSTSEGYINPKTMSLGFKHVAYLNN
jgi:hypothetical protein